MDINSIVSALQVYFPLSLQEGWDNSGLQISPQSSSIKGALLSLDVGLDTIEEARELGCNLIIAHHPLLFSSTKKIYGNFYPYNVVQEAIRNGIGVYAFHTNLDIAKNGLNDYLCTLLDLSNVTIVEKHPPLRIGEMKSEMTIDKFIDYVKDKLQVDNVKCTLYGSKTVKKVAICSGSCAKMAYEILDEVFDVFITGDLKHHDAFFAKETGLNIIDATHFHTEKFAKYIMRDVLKKSFPDMKILISNKDKLPWIYK